MRRLLAVRIPMIIAASVGSAVSFQEFAGAANHPAAFLLAESREAVMRAGSVRFADQSMSGSVTQEIDGAVSASTASESATGDGPPFIVELVGNLAYVKGPSVTLEHALGLTQAQADPVNGQWISVTPTDSAFSSLTGSLTLTQALNDFIPSTRHLTLGKPRKIDGHHVIVLQGTPKSPLSAGSKSSVALFLSKTSPHLPVGATLTVTQGKNHLHEVAAFKDWGAQVTLTAPTGVTPIKSIIGT